MNILILGNGFDIAHGLKTKYSDFLDYCETKYKYTEPRNIDKDSNFLFNNVWIKHFLNKKINGDKWIDLEKEIYNVIVILSKLPYFQSGTSQEKYKNIPFLISKYYMDFNFDEVNRYFRKPEGIIERDCYYIQIKDFIKFLHNQLRDFVMEFEKYLKDEVMRTVKNTSKYNFRIDNSCVSLLNFNYTNTCEKLYNINFTHNNCGIKTKAVYVHGKINYEDGCNLVLGTHSFDNEQIMVDFNIFKKHNQRHRYETMENYQELLNELKYPKKIYTPVFHIIGHSLDKTDHNILKHILLAREKSIINIYYHDEESQERLINNITEIIGEDEVMAKVRFIHQHDPKRGILIPIEQPVLIEN